MAKLLFFDTEHEYTLDGEKLPSVSEVCRFISRELYGDIGQFQLDNAAERGSAVHKATEILDKYGKAEISEEIEPYLKAYLLFRKEHKVEWQYIEYATYHPDKLYAGTIDRLGLVDGETWLVDIKSTANITPAHRTLYTAQLNLYRRMLSIKPAKLAVLQLKKNGAYRVHELPIEDGLADACLTLHRALQKRRRKMKEDNENG